MVWLSWAKEKLWDDGLIGRFVQSAGTYTYKTITHLFEQIGALPKVANSLSTHSSAKKISYQMAYIAIQDLLPMILVNTVNASLQNAYNTPNKDEEASWVSTAFLLSSSLALLQWAVTAYNVRQGIQMTTRTMLVALSAPNNFNKINSRQKSPLCIEDKCTIAQHIKSGGVELVKLTANDLAVSALGQLPYMNNLSWMISIYVRGRYILISTTPERCAKHRAIESENAFALGLGHEGLMMLLRHCLSQTIGLPPALCLYIMGKMLLVFQMAVAAHLTPPLVKSGEGTLAIDPLETYESITGWSTKVIAQGLMKEVPGLFKGPATYIPWNKIVTSIYHVNNHPVAQKIKIVILPSLLQSDRNFVNDPVIKELWTPLYKQFDGCLTVILNVGRDKPVLRNLANWAPGTTSLALKLTFGIPQKVTKALVFITGDANFRHVLQGIQNWIQSLGPEQVNLVSDSRPAVYVPENCYQMPALPVNKEKTIIAPEMLDRVNKQPVDPEKLLAREKPETADIGFFARQEVNKTIRSTSKIPEPSIDELLGF